MRAARFRNFWSLKQVPDLNCLEHHDSSQTRYGGQERLGIIFRTSNVT